MRAGVRCHIFIKSSAALKYSVQKLLICQGDMDISGYMTEPGIKISTVLGK